MELPALKVGKPRPTPVVRGGITKKIFRTIKNILFPRVYMPWEQPGITDLSSAELQELIALIDAHLAELDENGEIE